MTILGTMARTLLALSVLAFVCAGKADVAVLTRIRRCHVVRSVPPAGTRASRRRVPKMDLVDYLIALDGDNRAAPDKLVLSMTASTPVMPPALCAAAPMAAA